MGFESFDTNIGTKSGVFWGRETLGLQHDVTLGWNHVREKKVDQGIDVREF